MSLDADVFILCAGLGTRLRPLTMELPKPAVPLVNRPLVGYTLAAARSIGADRVIINTHWLGERMANIASAEGDRLGLEVAVSHEEQILGTGGVFRLARDRGLLRRAPLLVLNGDVLFDIDLAAVLAQHRASNAAATMVLRPMPPGATYTPVLVEKDRVTRIGAHGPSDAAGTAHLFTGVHVLSPEALDLLPPGESGIIETVYRPLLDRGAPISAFRTDAAWLDLGDPAGYLEANLALAGGAPRLVSRFSPPAPVAPSARTEQATLVDSIVGDGARVEAGAHLTRCVVWPGARVEPGERLHRVIVTLHARVQATN